MLAAVCLQFYCFGKVCDGYLFVCVTQNVGRSWSSATSMCPISLHFRQPQSMASDDSMVASARRWFCPCNFRHPFYQHTKRPKNVKSPTQMQPEKKMHWWSIRIGTIHMYSQLNLNVRLFRMCLVYFWIWYLEIFQSSDNCLL